MTFLRVHPRYRVFNNNRLHSQWTPATDIIEGKDVYTLTFDLPGVDRDDIKVSLNEDVLTVSGERKPNVPEDETYYRHYEKSDGKFSRSFRIPNHINGENIKAIYQNGVLTLELPKKEEAKLHTIKIK